MRYWKNESGKDICDGNRERRYKQLLFGLKEKRGYPKLKEDSLDRLCGKLVLEEATDLS